MLLPAVLPDTNYLMDFPLIEEENWLLDPLEILISETVTIELAGIAKDKDLIRAEKAKRALNEIETQRALAERLPSETRKIRIKFVKRYTDAKPPLNAFTPDHQLIACARALLTARQPRFCAVLSNDKELCDIAEALSVIAINRINETRFHQELQRKFEWWQKSHNAAQLGDDGRKAVCPKPSLKDKSVQSHVCLEKTAWRLMRRLRAAGNRSALYMAPLSGRIEIAIQTIKHNLKLKNRRTLVVCESLDAANHWAGEIRQQELVQPDEISTWEACALEASISAPINFCTYSQVETLFPQYITRLHQAGGCLTVLANGCDLLDPVAAAVLLHESDQFFGINHYPVGYRNAPVSRLLNILLRNNLVLDYTFADAERDGWGHAGDLALQKIEFNPEEQGYWQELNANYVKQQEHAFKRHPELFTCTDFWAALTNLLNNAVDLEDVELIKNREEREQVSQLAQNKAQRVSELINKPHSRPYRRLVFDYERQWTPLLLKAVSEDGHQVDELGDGEDPYKTWDRFAGSGIDTLILSKVPDQDLPKVFFHQLIILTPLRPLPETLAMLDFALSHTYIKDPLRIDLLYTRDTPEELAMLEAAEAGFGINPMQ